MNPNPSKSRVRNGWTKARTDTLVSLLELGADFHEIAAAVGKSHKSVEAKVASMHGGYMDRARAAREAAEQRPTPRRNDDDRHLAAIAKANNGKGFPFLNIPPAYRVAA